jgi:hypothetical protein
MQFISQRMHMRYAEMAVAVLNQMQEFNQQITATWSSAQNGANFCASLIICLPAFRGFTPFASS